MDNLPHITGLALAAFQRILLPLSYTDFQIERAREGLIVISARGEKVALAFIALTDIELRRTRSPMALVASRLARCGFNVPEVA